MSEVKAEILDNEGLFTKDGLENLIAQLGTDKDKRNYTQFVNNTRLSAAGNEDELNAMYRSDWLSGKVVDVVPNDMTREWRSFTGDIEPDQVELLETEEARLQLAYTFNLAGKWARLYGTSLIVMSIDDGQEPDMPLDISGIKKGQLKHIKVMDRTQFNRAETILTEDPFNANYGFPEYYRFNRSSLRVHHSRVLRFDGVLLPHDEFERNNYVSDSVLDRLYDSIINLNIVTNGSASMVYETNVDIVKVKGLMGYLQTPEGEATLRKRFALATLLKSFNNMLLLDTEEDFQTKTNTFAGLGDLITKFSQILSGGSDIPATRLLGNSASGLNATGEGDLKNYYDSIKARQVNEYAPLLSRFDEIMLLNLGLNPEDDYSYQFNSLFQMTDSEKADIQLKNAQRDQIYLDRDAVTPEIIAKELQQDEVYTNITDEFIEELEDFTNGNGDFSTNNGPQDPNENKPNKKLKVDPEIEI